MKRKEKLIMLFILIMILTITLIYKVMTPQNVTKTNEQKNKLISMMYEQEDGKYVTSEKNKWPIRSYVFNQEKSYCENKSTLEWNNVSKRIKVKVTGTDKCYVYFDLEELGTEESPYRIRVIEDLVDLANEVNKGENYAGKIFTLEKDLDFHNPNDYENAYRRDYGDINKNNQDETLIDELTNTEGSGFIPIGNSEENSFQGTFDGQNKKIDNLYINNNLNDFIGLFGFITNVKINNLTISGNITSSISVEAGGFSGAGYNFSIINCQNNVNILGSAGTQSIGGFVGSAVYNNVIKNSKNYGNISNGNNTGGFIGNNAGTILIDSSQNYGIITNEKGNHAGGLLGRDGDATNSTTIINSHNEGSVTINCQTEGTKFAGGLVGLSYGSLIVNKSYNIGDIIGSPTDKCKYVTGGLLGVNYSSSAFIINSYNAGNVLNKSTANNTASGILADSYDYTNTYIINSYNVGKIYTNPDSKGGWYTNGFVMGGNANSHRTVYINNAYNLGELDGVDKKGVGYLPPAENFTITNTYYRTGTGITASSQGEVATGMDYTQMQTQNFVNILNDNLATIDLGTTLKEITGIGLLGWKLGSDNIPTFDEENIYYPFTGNYQEFITPENGYYQIELWGASGGSRRATSIAGKGAYAKGIIKLVKDEKLYVYVGEYPSYTTGSCLASNPNHAFNGSRDGSCAGGGGATDVRLQGGEWDNFEGLKSRIIVAAGGGGAASIGNAGDGGTLNGLDGVGQDDNPTYYAGKGATQQAYTFGTSYYATCTPGNGYYAGQIGHGGNAGGGSSFISGYYGCDAISSSSTSDKITHTGQPVHYSGKKFSTPFMLAGNTKMPSPNGSTETGHTGNGYAKITLVKNVIEDLSGNGNNGLDYSVSKSSEGYTTSDASKNGYINMGLTNYDFGDSLSFVIRVKFNSLDGTQEFMGNWDAAGGGCAMSDGKLAFAQYILEKNSPNYYGPSYTGKSIIEANKWYTIVGTYDGTNIKAYVNGEEDASSSVSGQIKPSLAFIALGANPSHTGGLDGAYSYTTFSDALVFDRALTAEEIAQNYVDVPNPENKDELLVWYKFGQ